MASFDNPPNKLLHSSSPYLLQHAYNPVEWNEWSKAIWQEAKNQNKLVLVSIGYSTCHWCHVMEKESFEDYETAEIMNQHMVSIKVDREERPDIDMFFMDACQLMTQKGGWPLNAICLPDGRPVYAGTYFPKSNWQNLILQLSQQFKESPEKFSEYAENVQNEMQNMANPGKVNEYFILSRNELFQTFQNYIEDVDWEEGGKTRVPKFMVPIQYEYALDYHLLTEDPRAKEFLHLSLLKWANGGIYDNVRGGFYRYSTDRYWFAPHFEKMLYDNAQMLSLFSRAFAWSKADIYKEVTVHTWEFIKRELKDPSGGYYSGLDADSEGIEGKYYVFTYDELKAHLTEIEFKWIQCWSKIEENGNWEDGFNIIYGSKAPLQVVEELGISGEDFYNLKLTVLTKLFEAQTTRVTPSCDTKILASWNGLMLKGLSDCAYYLDDNMFLNEALKLAEFLVSTLWDDNEKVLFRTFSNGKRYTPGFLEDYASVSQGLIHLFKASQDEKWLFYANDIIEAAIEQFFNEERNQFLFSGTKNEALLVQRPDITDDVIPSSSTLLAVCLQELFNYTGEIKFKKYYNILLSQAKEMTNSYPSWHTGWARLFLIESVGNGHAVLHNWQGEIKIKGELPSWFTIFKSNSESELHWLKYTEKQSSGIYTCIGDTCFEPVKELESAAEIIADYYSLSGA